ncbi:MAG: hypothetical protein ACI36V_03305 [Coriobacteriales bacterium]
MPNAGTWFCNVCLPASEGAPCHALLCYDTDEYNADVSKFFDDDWQRLRQSIGDKAASITDLAAEADIEDILLCDLAGVLAYLGLEESSALPNGRRGKAKLRKLYRAAGRTYHSGDRAKPLIDFLDMDAVEAAAPFDLGFVRELLEKLK